MHRFTTTTKVIESLIPKAITDIMEDSKKVLTGTDSYRLTYIWEGNKVIYVTLDQNINRVLDHLNSQGANATHYSECLIPSDIGRGEIEVLTETILDIQPKYNKCLPCLRYKPTYQLVGNLQYEINTTINKDHKPKYTVKPNDLAYILNVLDTPKRALHGKIYYDSNHINWTQVTNVYVRLKLA